MVSWLRSCRHLICLATMLSSTVFLEAGYKLNYAQVGTSLSFPGENGNSWAVTGDSILSNHSSPQVEKAEFIHLSFPLSGWREDYNGTGWKSSPWLGAYKTDQDPWVYHASMGWVYLQQNAIDSIWLWQEELGWVWTHSTLFPYFYQENPTGWLSLDPQSQGPALVYDFSNSFWFELGRPWKTLQIKTSVGGKVSAPVKFRKGDDLSITALPDPGYVFSGWSGDHTGHKNPLFLEKVNLNLDLNASFTLVSEVITRGADSAHFDHLESEDLQKKAKLELALYGSTNLISTGQSKNYEFSPEGNKELKLNVALGKADPSTLIGVFEPNSSNLSHPLLSWKTGDTPRIQVEGSTRGFIDVDVTGEEVTKGVLSTVLVMTYPDLRVEKRWVAQDNLENIWLIESTMDDETLQLGPTMILPKTVESEWQSWLPGFAIPQDRTVVLSYPSSVRSSSQGLVADSAILYLQRENQLGQNEAYAPGLGLVKISIP